MPVRRYIPGEDLTVSYFFDDFAGGLYNNRIWSTRAGSGSVAVPTVAIGGQIVVQAAATNYYEVYVSVLESVITRKYVCSWRGKVASLTSSRGAFGIQTDANNRIEWLYEAALGANWQARCVSASVATVVDTGIAADTVFHEFKIVMNTSLAHFILDEIPRATIITNVPTGGLSPFLRSTSTMAATKDIYADWVETYGGRL